MSAVIPWLIGLFVFVVLAAGAAFVMYMMGVERVTKAATTPTPKEAEIKVETAAKLDANAKKAAAAASEVAHASKDDLLRIGRKELDGLPLDAPADDSTKGPDGSR